MPRATFLLGAMLLFSAGGVHAADAVHKCATTDGIVYQGTPCEGARREMQSETDVAVATVATLPPRVATAAAQPGACGARPGASARGLWRRGALCLGITDDEVLNLPAWGRPGAVERVRVREGWREAWRYASATGRSKRLSFLNGRLESVEDGARDAPDGAPVRVSVIDPR